MPGFVRAVALAERSLLGISPTRRHPGVAVVDEARREGLRVILLSDRTFPELRTGGDLLLPHFDGVVAESGAAVKVGSGPVRRVGLPPRGALFEVLDELDVDPHDTLGVTGSGDDAELLGALEVAVRVNRAGSVPGRAVRPARRGAAGGRAARSAGAPATRRSGAMRRQGGAGRRGADYGVPGPGAVALRRVLDDARAGFPATSPPRHDVTVPASGYDGDLHVPGAHANVLVCGAAAGDALPERLVDQWTGAGYSSVVLDLHTVGPSRRRRQGRALDAASGGAWLDDFQLAMHGPRAPVVLALGGLLGDERSRALSVALAAVRAGRARTGRPHWLVIDSAEPVFTDPSLPPYALDLGDAGHCLVLREHGAVGAVPTGAVDVVVRCGSSCPLPPTPR